MIIRQSPPSALQIVRDFADDPIACEHDWQRSFELARLLRGLGGNAVDYRQAIELYCELTGEKFLDFFSEFIDDWPKIEFPLTGEDTFLWAYEKAKCEPVPMPADPPAPEYAVVGSMAWHLAQHNPRGTFMLPVGRIADLFDCQKSTASNILKWLRVNGVIVCENEKDYEFRPGKKRKCKVFRLNVPMSIDGNPVHQGLPRTTEGSDGLDF